MRLTSPEQYLVDGISQTNWKICGRSEIFSSYGLSFWNSTNVLSVLIAANRETRRVDDLQDAANTIGRGNYKFAAKNDPYEALFLQLLALRIG
jgi:hypothetical protein